MWQSAELAMYRGALEARRRGVGPSQTNAPRHAMPSATNSRSASSMQTSPAPRQPTLPHSRSVPQQASPWRPPSRPIPLPSQSVPKPGSPWLRPKPETPLPSPSPHKLESRSLPPRQEIPLHSRWLRTLESPLLQLKRGILRPSASVASSGINVARLAAIEARGHCSLWGHSFFRYDQRCSCRHRGGGYGEHPTRLLAACAG